MHRPGRQDPHRREWKFIFFLSSKTTVARECSIKTETRVLISKSKYCSALTKHTEGQGLTFWMRMHPYTYLCLAACLSARPPVCPSKLLVKTKLMRILYDLRRTVLYLYKFVLIPNRNDTQSWFVKSWWLLSGLPSN
jgi:hypothetical protein